MSTPASMSKSQRNFRSSLQKVVDIGQQSDSRVIDEGWEYSSKFELVLSIIGRNRKMLLELFKQEQRNKGTVTHEAAKLILSQILDRARIRLSEKNWRSLLMFAQRNDTIDYQFMFEVFKQRLIGLNTHPKKPIQLA